MTFGDHLGSEQDIPFPSFESKENSLCGSLASHGISIEPDQLRPGEAAPEMLLQALRTASTPV